MTHPARVDDKADLSQARLPQFDIDQFQVAVGLSDCGGSIGHGP
jgi:hypothetical protein